MDIGVIRQTTSESIESRRFGDALSHHLEEGDHSEFLFATAFLRESGLNRLSRPLANFREVGGSIAGAIGVDSGVTSIEALESLQEIAPDSTVFGTITNLIFHPKVYLFKGELDAVAIVGSANLTRDGLFRNIEFGTELEFDLNVAVDRSVFEAHEDFVRDLLDTSNPNIQPLSDDVLEKLVENDLVETGSIGGGEGSSSRTHTTTSDETREMFPSVEVATPPPTTPVAPIGGKTPDNAQTFVMQLSSSDSSHRTGTPGTPMILIPKDAIGFFPDLLPGGDTKHPDSFFDVRLNTPDGPEIHTYRFWYYEEKEEYRLRVDNETIDLTTPDGGDLIVLTELVDEPDLEYEMTIVKPEDSRFDELVDMCDQIAQDKIWDFD